jgi:hypothetical protein
MQVISPALHETYIEGGREEQRLAVSLRHRQQRNIPTIINVHGIGKCSSPILQLSVWLLFNAGGGRDRHGTGRT